MTKFKLKIDVDLSDKAQLWAMNNLFAAVGGQDLDTTKPEEAAEVAKPEAPKAEEEKAPTPVKKKRRTKAQIEAAKVEQVAGEEEEEEEEETGVAEKKSDEIEFTDVRALFAKILQNGDEDTRTACIGKLSELGTTNLPGLKEESFGEFMDFLNSL